MHGRVFSESEKGSLFEPLDPPVCALDDNNIIMLLLSKKGRRRTIPL